MINGPDADTTWIPTLSNEWGRLAQGNDSNIQSTDTIEFISYDEVPTDKKVTYCTFTCDHHPLKSEPWRIRLVVGGDKLKYAYDTGTPATNLVETKKILNSIILNAHKGDRFMSFDLKDMFLKTPMKQSEYMKRKMKYFLSDIINKYNLNNIVHNEYIYIKIKRGVYGLKQAAILAY